MCATRGSGRGTEELGAWRTAESDLAPRNAVGATVQSRGGELRGEEDGERLAVNEVGRRLPRSVRVARPLDLVLDGPRGANAALKDSLDGVFGTVVGVKIVRAGGGSRAGLEAAHLLLQLADERLVVHRGAQRGRDCGGVDEQRVVNRVGVLKGLQPLVDGY